MGTLYLVATPIGNLEDISLRALRVLRESALIAAEDTRQTRKLLARHDIHKPLVSYHEHNKEGRAGEILDALEHGDVALVSDAGTPGLSDPGYDLVQSAIAAGYRVSPVPGPSAPVAALVASGLPADEFVFVGYLPRRSADRLRLLGRLSREKRTIVAFEAPHRLRRSVDDLIATFGESRSAAVCRELTKIHEEILRDTLGGIRDHFKRVEPRGEFTLVIRGALDDLAWELDEVRSALAARLGSGMSPTQAARIVAAQAGWPRREVYRLALEGR
jgi:16S rRNA (cytidine1402-2'-O)-methyltransferase